MKYRTLFITLALFALVFAGCSKHSPNPAVANPKGPNLGIVDVSDGIQSRHDLGGGRVCIITPAIQKDGTLLLALRIEQDGKLLAAPRVKTMSDLGFEVAVGDVSIGMTPHIKQ